MSAPPPTYGFFSDLARILNSGQSRTVLLYGNVHDLFFIKGEKDEGRYVPLIPFLCDKCQVKGQTLLVYELNGPLRFHPAADREKVRSAWTAWKMGLDAEQLVLAAVADKAKLRQREMIEAEFDANLQDAIGKPTLALEFLRQLTICSRATAPGGRRYLAEDLLILVEAADLLLPSGDGDISHLNQADRRRVAVAQDWFSDPGLLAGQDSVVLVADSQSLVHPRVSRLPSVLTVEAPSPNQAAREHYISWFMSPGKSPAGGPGRSAGGNVQPPKLWLTEQDVAAFTAGLSIHALRQLLIGGAHAGRTLTPAEVIAKVEEFIQSQLGEDVVEFKKPLQTLDDCVGFSRLKEFIRQELIPRFRSSGPDALPGAAVAGPIGGGKTYLFEAAAGALGLPVLVLKNIRSQWFGQTDVIFERLRRVLEALGKVVIFVDEADTQFGGVGPNAHETERRLTGKIQQMMSDPALRGRVIWLLMTARIHLLSPDIRRPGRVGDLIIPVLDPEGPDRQEFIRWVLSAVPLAPIVAGALRDPKAAAAESAAPPGEAQPAATAKPQSASDDLVRRLDALTANYSAAAFASLRSHLKAKAANGPLTIEEIEHIIHDHIQPAIGLARRYQTLQALVNCTRRSLLPDPSVTDETRQAWQAELRKLEAMGIE